MADSITSTVLGQLSVLTSQVSELRGEYKAGVTHVNSRLDVLEAKMSKPSGLSSLMPSSLKEALMVLTVICSLAVSCQTHQSLSPDVLTAIAHIEAVGTSEMPDVQPIFKTPSGTPDEGAAK